MQVFKILLHIVLALVEFTCALLIMSDHINWIRVILILILLRLGALDSAIAWSYTKPEE